jgi:DNA-binding NtrC family response regulator
VGEAAARSLTLDEMEREYVHLVLASAGGNKTEAAAILQIDRRPCTASLRNRKPTLHAQIGARAYTRNCTGSRPVYMVG